VTLEEEGAERLHVVPLERLDQLEHALVLAGDMPNAAGIAGFELGPAVRVAG
jgi:hypothetical protein